MMILALEIVELENRSKNRGVYKKELMRFTKMNRAVQVSENEIQSISDALSNIGVASDAASDKYGLTFSVSDITAVSLSEFYSVMNRALSHLILLCHIYMLVNVHSAI